MHRQRFVAQVCDLQEHGCRRRMLWHRTSAHTSRVYRYCIGTRDKFGLERRRSFACLNKFSTNSNNMQDINQLMAHMDLSVPSVMDFYMNQDADFFDQLMWESHKQPQIMWFHADWCGHCVRMKDAWEEAKTYDGAKWHAINCSDDRTLAQKMDVTAFPTIMKYSKGRLSEFSGDRSSKNLINFAA